MRMIHQTGSWFAAIAMLVLLASSVTMPLHAQENPSPAREQIGTVFGKPVYRDQIRTGKQVTQRNELHRLFLSEVANKYRERHAADITPTETEIAAATRFFDDEHRTRIRDEESKLRERLQTIERQLAANETKPEQQKMLETQKQRLELQLQPPGRPFALFVLTNWKFQKHLYDQYGGGRILWQQAGVEAFDAYRTWLESCEKAGEFTITDPNLRATFYEYWTTMNHGAFLTDNPQRIREEFLEPRWLAKAVATK